MALFMNSIKQEKGSYLQVKLLGNTSEQSCKTQLIINCKMANTVPSPPLPTNIRDLGKHDGDELTPQRVRSIDPIP